MAHIDKRIEDYLHLYLGCEVITNFGIDPPVHYILKGIQYEQKDVLLYCDKDGLLIKRRMSFHDFKPILRPLSDMSEEEAKEGNIGTFAFKCIKKEILSYAFIPKHFLFLLSKHFDLFGLIEAGLAIDKTSKVNRELK